MKSKNSLSQTKIIWLFRILSIGFIAVFAFIIYSADRGTMPKAIARLYAYSNGDLVGHFFLMGSFAFMMNGGLGGQVVKIRKLFAPLGSLIVTGIITLEEISQAFFPTRHISLLDLLASYLGILFIGSLSVWIVRGRLLPIFTDKPESKPENEDPSMM